MKKFTSILAIAFMALMAMTFTSCDEDAEIAYTLEGTWSGNMYVSMEYDGRVYDATYSELCFSRDPYRYSSGTDIGWTTTTMVLGEAILLTILIGK